MLKPTNAQIRSTLIRIADGCNTSRQAMALAFLLQREDENALRNDGIAIIPDFLPEADFEGVRAEAKMAMAKAEQDVPIRVRDETGFGAPEVHDWGFDRFDGGTLNRFVDIDPLTMPATYGCARHGNLSRLCRVGLGMARPPRRPMIYLTVHGREEANHDIQKDLHRDSSYRKMKYWYFLEPVGEDDGPFVYVPGSHKLTPGRLEWERSQANKSGRSGFKADPSYRVAPSDLPMMKLPQPRAVTVSANTLVIADTYGFHRRGDAKSGARRLAVYGQKKPWPFAPIGI